MSEIYPSDEKSNQSNPYYVEFERGDIPNEFTIFKRHFMHSEEEWQKILDEHPKGIFASNEVHPWNIFTATFGSDGCVPDKKWVKWMVDALNVQCGMDRIEITDYSS